MEMGIRQVLSGVLSRYLSGSQTNDIDAEIRNNFPKVILANIPPSFGSYSVKGLAGMGRRAQVPLLCIFDSRVTNRAGRGYYLAYLFKTDMTGVYLSLNQAWEPFIRLGGAAIGRETISKCPSGFGLCSDVKELLLLVCEIQLIWLIRFVIAILQEGTNEVIFLDCTIRLSRYLMRPTWWPIWRTC